MATSIERLDNMLKGVNGWVDDWEIINQLDDNAAEEWGCMLSDIPVDYKQAALARANQFLTEHESMFRVFDVAENGDEYNWAFILA